VAISFCDRSWAVRFKWRFNESAALFLFWVSFLLAQLMVFNELLEVADKRMCPRRLLFNGFQRGQRPSKSVRERHFL
jgi:hypothetical protein